MLNFVSSGPRCAEQRFLRPAYRAGLAEDAVLITPHYNGKPKLRKASDRGQSQSANKFCGECDFSDTFGPSVRRRAKCEWFASFLSRMEVNTSAAAPSKSSSNLSKKCPIHDQNTAPPTPFPLRSPSCNHAKIFALPASLAKCRPAAYNVRSSAVIRISNIY